MLQISTKTKIIPWGVAAALFTASAAWGDVRLPSLVGNGMVLQRDSKVELWGWADPNEEIRIDFQGKRVKTKADRKGRWSVSVGPYSAGGPHTMTLSGKSAIALRDILIGDVWLASGQSNMEWPVKGASGAGIDNAEREVAVANFPRIRLFAVKHDPSAKPTLDVKSDGWRAVTPETVSEFSAVAYLFGRELHERYQVPIGLIQSAVGGTVAEAWTSEAGLKRFPEFRDAVMLAASPSPNTSTVLFNGMIHALTPFRIKGVIWYQGEANAKGRGAGPARYRALFPALIQDWRHQWGYEFPFLFVQLAGFGANDPEPAEYPWAELREAQSMTLSLPATGMATAIDIGDEQDIHPRNKQDVAHRLALVAAKVAYGEDIVYSGPTYQSMRIEGERIRIKFSSLGSGLLIKDKYGYGRGFEIAAADGKFHWAQAHQDGEDIVVFNKDIPQPVAVRYAWSNTPDGNVFNREGLPAVPFRTDAPKN